MLQFKTILEAARYLVGERFPDEPIYMDRVPSRFSRPSFLVEGGAFQVSDASRNCLEVTSEVKITLFVAVNEYHNGHVDELIRRMASVQELFAAEGFIVSDRVLQPTKNTGQYQFDYAEVTVAFTYQDDRPGGEDWPLMRKVHTKLKEGS